MSKLNDDINWFKEFSKTPQFAHLKERPIAYFCTEYGLQSDMHIYAGGLGILAGDIIREAADRDFPLVAVGIYYREGYVCEIDATQTTSRTAKSPLINSALEPVNDANGNRLIVIVPIQDRDVEVQAWQYRQGSVTVYLLDTNVSKNVSSCCAITNRLYTADKEMRLKQECVLGIGGLRLLEKLNIHPSLYHLNEGHSAMLTLELIKHEMDERSLSFDEAKQFARRRVVFTNHTLVPAGNDVYSNDLVSLILWRYARDISVPLEKLIDLGLVQESSTFSMTMLSLRMSGIVNAVSELHARKAAKIWTDHPMVGVTNGVHVPMWDRIKKSGEEDGKFWHTHQEQKRILLDILKQKAGVSWGEDELLLGWARRIVHYKRPLALVEDVERLIILMQNEKRPIRLLFSGKPHSNDKEGLEIYDTLLKLTEGPLKDLVVFVPDYSIELAQKFVAGCDAWVNTPIVGFEACGTSGMKAALNGSLALTTKDGWYDEIDIAKIGWELLEEPVGPYMLELLGQEIAPLYYKRNKDGVPEEWEAMMRRGRELILERFSATRLLRQYMELLYS